MTEYRESTRQERMDLLAEINTEMVSAIEEWCKRWNLGEDGSGEQVCLRYITDEGHVLVEVASEPVMMITFAVETAVVPGEYAEYVAKPNQPTGFITSKAWGEISAGWFVRAPSGEDWFEVLGVAPGTAGMVMVTIDVNGTQLSRPRDPAGTVSVRRGTVNAPLNAALQALNGAGITTEILEDRSS